jgi:hypothetical protein
MKKSLRLFAAAFLLSSTSSHAQITDSLIIKAAPQFSGQVAIVKNDSVIYSFSKGWMNYPLQIPMNKNLLLEIGELSSFFTRKAIYDLIENNKINADSSVAKYIPGFPYKTITIQHLLNQSSGLPSNYLKLYHRYIFDDENIKVKDKTKDITNIDIVNILIKFKPALEFNPGEKSVQCNTNDIVLAYIIELMNFKSYETTINEMTAAKYKDLKIVANSDLQYTPMPSRASGHKKTDLSQMSVEESLKDFGFKYSDGTMGHHHVYANAESLAKYLAGFTKAPITYTGHEPGYNSLISFNKGMTIVILSNTSDESDTQLILKAILSEL